MPIDSREHEPRVTVDGGADGLDVLRRAAGVAAEWLAPGGRVFVEVSRAQAAAAVAAYEQAGLTAAVHHSEEYDATVVAGTR